MVGVMFAGLLAMSSGGVVTGEAVKAGQTQLGGSAANMLAFKASEGGKSAPSCLSFPLPTTPSGPRWTKRYIDPISAAVGIAMEVNVTVWRQPCGEGRSAVLVTLSPATPASTYCPSSVTIIQGASELSSIHVAKDADARRLVCGNIWDPVTGWLFNLDSVQLNPDKSFILVDSNFTGDGRLSVPAYDPAAYGSTPAPGSITKDYSGSWFTPGEQVKNQGWALIFNEELKMAGAYWFTGSVDGKSLEWFTVVGSYEGDTAVMDIYKTKDVTFIGATGSTARFGSFTIEFESCSKGVATYNMADGRKGSLPIERLIPAPEGCR